MIVSNKIKYIRVEDACMEIDRGDLLVGNNADWAKEIIHRTPTVEVREVAYGSWKRYSATMMECSACKRHVTYHKYEYCPHCGTKMVRGD